MVANNIKTIERRTSVDLVFDHLYGEIVSMRLLPGTKISEAEMAGLFDISRQPVRDAFSRLENLDLLVIRPQKATEVKRFSSTAITTARFVRAAIESEVLRRASRACDENGATILQDHIKEQRQAVEQNDSERFHSLDYSFHELLCQVAKVDYAVDVIASNKAKVDRLCVLGLSRDEKLEHLLDDHISIAQKVQDNNEEAAVEAGMLHLSRLDSTIESIREEHADYFYD